MMQKEEQLIKLDKIKSFLPEVATFISENPLEQLKCGTYYLQKGIHVNIDNYETQSRDVRRFESHKKYIDLQCIISGSEIISVCEIDSLASIENYDPGKDIEFYKVSDGKDYIMAEGDCLLLYPNNAHMPCVCINSNNTASVKKAVFKIPIQYFMDIKFIVMDVDGTLTDGKIYMGENGELFKAFNIKDGCGIHDVLPRKGIVPIIITARNSKILKNRCKELGITEVYQGVNDKLTQLQTIMDVVSGKGNKLYALSNVAYIGDDLPDIQCMKVIKEQGGIIGCPSDAVEEVKKIADYICCLRGGDGAVREFIDWI